MIVIPCTRPCASNAVHVLPTPCMCCQRRACAAHALHVLTRIEAALPHVSFNVISKVEKH